MAAPVCWWTARRISPRVEFCATMVSCPFLKVTCGGREGICSGVGGGGGGAGGGGSGVGAGAGFAVLAACFFGTDGLGCGVGACMAQLKLQVKKRTAILDGSDNIKGLRH